MITEQLKAIVDEVGTMMNEFEEKDSHRFRGLRFPRFMVCWCLSVPQPKRV